MKRLACIFLLAVSGAVPAAEPLVWFTQADRLEYRSDDESWLWDMQGWVGGDERKIWWKTEGDIDGDNVTDTELQLLYSRAISPFFDLQLGLRHDMEPDPNRTFAVIGFQGLAPQWFEIDTAIFVGDDGDLAARFEAEYDLLLTQRLILQPRFEFNIGATKVPELALGSGIRDTQLGLRLRYEIRREFAPYFGVSWSRAWGNTADLVEARGEDSDSLSFVVGARIWF